MMELSWNCSASGEPQGPVCDWFGVGCDIDGAVTSLSLSDLYLTGTLPSSIGYLSGLQSLNLSDNSLTGTLPSTVGFIFHNERINPSVRISNSNLRILDISYNLFYGTLPSAIGLWVSLVSLNVSSNYFHGSIPSSLENLSQLRFLRLESNFFSGVIPPLCALVLQELYFYDSDSFGNSNLTCFQDCIPSAYTHNYGNLALCPSGT